MARLVAELKALNREMHPIEQHYRNCDERRRKAQEELDQARESGASVERITQLVDKVLWAGYTGD